MTAQRTAFLIVTLIAALLASTLTYTHSHHSHSLNDWLDTLTIEFIDILEVLHKTQHDAEQNDAENH